MGLQSYLQDTLVFLSAAILVVTLVKRVLKSPFLGYLLAGLLIGPFGLNYVKEVSQTKHLAEFGVVFLLFTIGLELSWERLVSLRRYVFGLGTAQVFITSTIIALIVNFGFNLPLGASIIIGAGLALSSTAVVVQILAERGDLASRYGRISFSILLFQDLAVVLFLVLVNFLTNEEGEISTHQLLIALGVSVVKGIVVLVAIGFLGRVLLRPVYRFIANTKNSELFVAMTLLLILLTGYTTNYFGLSMELGAFLAGLLLAETEYRHQVESDIHPFRGLLLGLFFISMGMGIDIRLLWDNLFIISGLLLFLLFGKFLIVFVLGKLFKLWWSTSLRIALLLSAGGEFAFVLFAPSAASGLFPPNVVPLLYLIVAISMALTPLLGHLGKLLSNFVSPFETKNNAIAIEEETRDMTSHVVIVGFGRIGNIIARLLNDQMIPFVAIDMNMARVSEGRKLNLPVFFGDARRAEIFHAISMGKAKAVVLTLDQPGTVSRAVMTLKRNFPKIPIFVRAHDNEHAEKLKKAGAVVVVPEMLEPSLQLGSQILLLAGVSKDQVNKSVETLRHKLLEQTTPSSLEVKEDLKSS
ncbi:MAG: cation:proton antiporter [Proteobacteria bacterium]|nr:cation:proton antiporter [Pseudomonadota bacterium]